jgi:DNA-directed RNA polymerase specialized sigma24 family protein
MQPQDSTSYDVCSDEMIFSRAFVARLKRRDLTAWDKTFTHYQRALQQTIRSTLAKSQLPTEWLTSIEHRTWLTAMEKIGEFQTGRSSDFLLWLNAIQHNLIKATTSKQRRH